VPMSAAVVDKEVAELRGVHRLAAAVLVQAIEDVRSGSARKRSEALHWIEDPSEAQFSFVFCCRLLNRNPEQVRRFLREQDSPAAIFARVALGSRNIDFPT